MLLERLTCLSLGGLFTGDEVYATTGEIISVEKQGRTDERVVSVFESTDIAIADIAIAKLIYDKVKRAGSHMSVGLVWGKVSR